MADVMYVCSRGCCNGCGQCYGYAIGCHQKPCRCDRPCTCTENEDGDYITRGCERHEKPKEPTR